MELYHPVEHKHRGIELLATEKNVSMSIVILKTWSMTKKNSRIFHVKNFLLKLSLPLSIEKLFPLNKKNFTLYFTLVYAIMLTQDLLVAQKI